MFGRFGFLVVVVAMSVVTAWSSEVPQRTELVQIPVIVEWPDGPHRKEKFAEEIIASANEFFRKEFLVEFQIVEGGSETPRVIFLSNRPDDWVDRDIVGKAVTKTWFSTTVTWSSETGTSVSKSESGIASREAYVWWGRHFEYVRNILLHELSHLFGAKHLDEWEESYMEEYKASYMHHTVPTGMHVDIDPRNRAILWKNMRAGQRGSTPRLPLQLSFSRDWEVQQEKAPRNLTEPRRGKLIEFSLNGQ